MKNVLIGIMLVLALSAAAAPQTYNDGKYDREVGKIERSLVVEERVFLWFKKKVEYIAKPVYCKNAKKQLYQCGWDYIKKPIEPKKESKK